MKLSSDCSTNVDKRVTYAGIRVSFPLPPLPPRYSHTLQPFFSPLLPLSTALPDDRGKTAPGWKVQGHRGERSGLPHHASAKKRPTFDLHCAACEYFLVNLRSLTAPHSYN